MGETSWKIEFLSSRLLDYKFFELSCKPCNDVLAIYNHDFVHSDIFSQSRKGQNNHYVNSIRASFVHFDFRQILHVYHAAVDLF